MSIEVIVDVWEHSTLRGTNLLVMLALADYASDDRVAWPSINTLRAKSRASRRQVQRTIQTAIEAGELEEIKPPPGTRRRTRTFRVMPRANDDATGGRGATVAPQGRHGGTRSVIEPSETFEQPPTESVHADDDNDDAPEKSVDKLLWDVFDELIGKVSNEAARGRRSRANKLVRESLAAYGVAEASWPDELRATIEEYQRRWPEIDLTEMGVAVNWDALHREPKYGERPRGVTPAEIRAAAERLRERGL